MEKTKIEQMVEQNRCVVEITIDHTATTVYIYDKDDMFLYSFRDELMNNAISKAVSAYFKRRDDGLDTVLCGGDVFRVKSSIKEIH